MIVIDSKLCAIMVLGRNAPELKNRNTKAKAPFDTGAFLLYREG